MEKTVEYEQIRFEIAEGIATLTLCRPERMNAWTYQMSAELVDAIERCNDNAEVGAMIITGEGRGFCAGADIEDTFKSRIDSKATEQRKTSDWVGLLRRSKPLIAAVNGASVGVGATMVLPCDVIIASE